MAVLAAALTEVPGARAATAAATAPLTGTNTTFAGGVGFDPALDVTHGNPLDVVRRGDLLSRRRVGDPGPRHHHRHRAGGAGPGTSDDIDLEGVPATATSASYIAAIAPRCRRVVTAPDAAGS